MSAPFGGHPKFVDYLVWARDTHECRAESGYASDGNGKTHTVTKISHPDGKSVVMVGLSQTEHLVPSTVGYLDRRLGISSPWFSVDLDEPPEVLN